MGVLFIFITFINYIMLPFSIVGGITYKIIELLFTMMQLMGQTRVFQMMLIPFYILLICFQTQVSVSLKLYDIVGG